MQETKMRLSVRKFAVAAFAIFLVPATLARAQEPVASPYSSHPNFGTPKAELFLGYSYLRAVPAPADGNRMMWLNGGSTSIAFNFNRHLGLVGDFGGFDDSEIRLANAGTNSSSVVDSSGTAYTYLFGPRLSFRSHERVTPFAQALFGGIHASAVTASSGCTGAGCMVLPVENSFAMTAGGGLDVKVSHHFAIRLVQAEYLMTRFENHATGASASQNDMRLSSGIVFRLGGGGAPPQVGLACSANPASVFPGDPVIVTATASELEPKLNVIYSLTGPGLSATEATATVATATLAPGSYTVNCSVKEGRPGREGLKPWESATATATFRVRTFDPPTIGCSASPSEIRPGETSTVSATGISPQNRPLTYNYTAAPGTISGSGSTATFNSAGAPTGPAMITCTVVDDKGQTATANTSVTVLAPPPPPVPPAEQVRLEARLALHSVFFPTAQPRAEHPEGGLLASQQGTLTTLATDFKSYLTFKPDAHLTLTGHCDVRGSVEYNQALSERRVARTKQFLVEQGVSEASIETRGLGKDQMLTADQVKDLVDQNPDLSTTEREKVLRNLSVIVLAQNRRVDVTLSTTGQQSVRLYPFNAADAATLLNEKALAPHKKAAIKK
jgi:outer membrane protein OmpA-like peptidoglycan-associated protein/opacity protein-like surface antigen